MLEIIGVSKQYQPDSVIFTNLNLRFEDQGLYFIVGKSGRGKTTLFNLIGRIDGDYQGEIRLNGRDIQTIANYQGARVTYLFQSFHLIEGLKTQPNITLPGLFNRLIGKVNREKVLQDLGIAQLGNRNVLKISGGQKSRVALMRALVTNPDIVLCDEPTGALDVKNAQAVLDYLRDLAKTKLVLVITHDLDLIDEKAQGVIDLDHLERYEAPLNNRVAPARRARIKTKHQLVNLALAQLKLDGRVNLKMALGLVLAVMTVLITLFGIQGIRNEVNLELTDIFGAATYTTRRKDEQPFTLDYLTRLQVDAKIDHLYLQLDDYELLGIGTEANLDEAELEFVGDATKGKTTTTPGVEISTRMARRLGLDVNSTKQEVYVYYRHDQEIKAAAVPVAAILDQAGILETARFDELANLETAAGLFYEEPAALEGQTLIVTGSSLDADYLVAHYPEIQVRQLGASLTGQINRIIDKVNWALVFFGGLSVVAAVFLVVEVMYLAVLKNRHTIGVYRILGATARDVLAMVLLEVVVIVTGVFALALVQVELLGRVVNLVITEVFAGELLGSGLIEIDLFAGFQVYMIMLLMALLAALFPALLAMRQEPLRVLQRR